MEHMPKGAENIDINNEKFVNKLIVELESNYKEDDVVYGTMGINKDTQEDIDREYTASQIINALKDKTALGVEYVQQRSSEIEKE